MGVVFLGCPAGNVLLRENNRYRIIYKPLTKKSETASFLPELFYMM
jgi:hypothetical protein